LGEQFSSSGGTVTQQSVIEASRIGKIELDVGALKNEISTNFANLYKETSDQTVDIFLASLDDLNKAIVESFTPQANILSCTKTINNRQCPASE